MSFCYKSFNWLFSLFFSGTWFYYIHGLQMESKSFVPYFVLRIFTSFASLTSWLNWFIVWNLMALLKIVFCHRLYNELFSFSLVRVNYILRRAVFDSKWELGSKSFVPLVLRLFKSFASFLWGLKVFLYWSIGIAK